ncbi:NAD(P)/FAD-dependent oxidoreductase [Parapedobacter koreensis]|uniref:Glycine/D-amino acid oxidase n=1 Tax=Parapedobacter koreensis TaxID=332977 RepID=A0A1H7JZP8_9SPHI|nr:FAD-dependent oxidoreductase [Parapedobacter koreensis]SEK79105.1 Glycine/D-amino acid oxidase [Parapedobacter koreensis]
MDLHSGLAYWIVKNELFDYFHPLRDDFVIDVAIIGSGITGSLVAHELCMAGIPCAVFDKRTIATGSTAASTSQLQYEIDVPLCEMMDKVGEKTAVKAYHASLQSITDIEEVFHAIRVNPDFKRVSSVYLASNRRGLGLLEREYEVRIKHGLPVEFLDADALLANHRIEGPGALKNREAAQMDCYQAATGLLRHHIKQHDLPLFSHTDIVAYEEKKGGYTLLTGDGKAIRCKYVVIAAGFEAGRFLPRQVMDLNSTYALVSQPVEASQLWPERSLIWETAHPYFYMRTTSDNRMMIGGEDVAFKNAERRDRLLRWKIKRLERQFRRIYPEIPFTVDMAWCGTFSSTRDGLPFIGPWPGKKRMFFALGYGGNGITFSMIAAQVIKNKLMGIKDERERIFGFGR